jgi:hypothetical protein
MIFIFSFKTYKQILWLFLDHESASLIFSSSPMAYCTLCEINEFFIAKQNHNNYNYRTLTQISEGIRVQTSFKVSIT